MHAMMLTWMHGPAGGLAALVTGAVLGHLLCRAVAEWFRITGDAPVKTGTRTLVTMAAAVGAAGLWWWEIIARGQVSAVSLASLPQTEFVLRSIAHLVLFWLLAAATWIDFRQRVIPDWITLPGTLTGLAAAWAWPRILLPVAVEVPRSFAAPVMQADVLGWYGGLEAATGGAFTAAPHVAGLALAAAIFAAWWLVCTEPAPDDGARWRAPRTLLILVGLCLVTAAWWLGTERFDGLLSALVGLAVSGGLVWTTRAGASYALGKEAMGLGDVTLMAMAGAWLGWQACVLTFFLAAFIGLGHGVAQYLRHRENELPFGPSLCLAMVLVVVAWRPLWRATAVHFEQPGQLALVIAAVVVLTAVTLSVWQFFRRSC
jgi:leader peptidase (prepilin peptidase) / N-methyltransferase